MSFEVIGKVTVYIATFGFLSFLVLWTLDCWWKVYKTCKGIPQLVSHVNKLKHKGHE